jgi:hypothetical protein
MSTEAVRAGDVVVGLLLRKKKKKRKKRKSRNVWVKSWVGRREKTWCIQYFIERVEG